MSLWEYEERCRLNDAYQAALLEFEQSLNDGDLKDAKERLEETQIRLEAWDGHVVQVIPSPSGMVAVFERRDGLEELIPVSYLALQRSGRVVPYIFTGNCQPKVPTHFASFLRIDFKELLGSGEVALADIGREETEPAEEMPIWLEQR